MFMCKCICIFLCICGCISMCAYNICLCAFWKITLLCCHRECQWMVCKTATFDGEHLNSPLFCIHKISVCGFGGHCIGQVRTASVAFGFWSKWMRWHLRHLNKMVSTRMNPTTTFPFTYLWWYPFSYSLLLQFEGNSCGPNHGLCHQIQIVHFTFITNQDRFQWSILLFELHSFPFVYQWWVFSWTRSSSCLVQLHFGHISAIFHRNVTSWALHFPYIFLFNFVLL